MSAALHDYLPKREKEKSRIMLARIPESLFEETTAALKADGLAVQDLIVAACRHYLEERKGKKPAASKRK